MGWGDGGEGAARERRCGGGAGVGEGHGWFVGRSDTRAKVVEWKYNTAVNKI